MAYQAVKDDVQGLIQRKDYFGALNLISGLRGPVDGFFEAWRSSPRKTPW